MCASAPLPSPSSQLSEEKLQEFRDSFAHFDANKNGWLDKIEFKAALSALSIPFKDDGEFAKVFTQVWRGGMDV